ncbi:hypothetical protein BCR34DRAFT_597020 [Clohesyomyces aquaticus]|uniref:Uncharacterized protein n=1 Tax=Clohesyomyces aquaticus TaxID=1231657 RepID=A0A1Y2A3Y7_9PLEO|nr:hypothetical protein BCR34DRAFT_597020 [Clohesyomyces aquaticus]
MSDENMAREDTSKILEKEVYGDKSIYDISTVQSKTSWTLRKRPTLFGLGWWDSFLALLFFNLVGAIPPVLIETFGPKTGIRTMAFQVSWGRISADYAVYMNENTKSWKIFFWTYNGLFWSGFLCECLDAALMTAVSGSAAFGAMYTRGGVGGLLGQIFEGYGTNVRNFGYFIETILSLSVVAVTAANIYSLGLNVQMVSDSLIKVPRFIWSLVRGTCFLVAAIAGRNDLQLAMKNFLNVIAYWLTLWLTIMLLEHFIWRRKPG